MANRGYMESLKKYTQYVCIACHTFNITVNIFEWLEWPVLWHKRWEQAGVKVHIHVLELDLLVNFTR